MLTSIAEELTATGSREQAQPKEDRVVARAAETVFNKFYDSMQSVAILVIDSSNHIVVYHNPFAEKMLGYSKEDSLIGKNYKEFFQESSPESHTPVQTFFSELLVPNVGFEASMISKEAREVGVQCRDKALIPCNINGFRNADIGSQYLVIILQDLRLEKKHEAERKEHFDKARQLTKALHELRTCGHALGAASVWLEDYIKSPLNVNDRLREISSVFSKSATQLMGIISTYLSGKSSVRKLEGFNLKEEVKKTYEILLAMQQKMLRTDIVMELNFLPREFPEELISGDALAINQILINIVANAINFTKKGSIKISFTAINDGPDNFKYILSIKDTGPGLSEEQQQDMWQAGNKVDSVSYSDLGRSGLGLSITKQLIEGELRGTVEVVSTDEALSLATGVPTGTEFIICFSLPKASSVKKYREEMALVASSPNSLVCRASEKKGKRRRAADHIALQPKSNGKKIHILAVDDNGTNLKILKSFFEPDPNVSLTIVENGLEAFRYLLKNDVDVVLMDQQMPIVNGVEAIEMMRALHDPQKRNVPIVFTPASDVDPGLCSILQITSVVPKPYKQPELVDAIDVAIQQSNAVCELAAPTTNGFMPGFEHERKKELKENNTKERAQYTQLLPDEPNKSKRRFCTIL